jgi:hypothetical protein
LTAQGKGCVFPYHLISSLSAKSIVNMEEQFGTGARTCEFRKHDKDDSILLYSCAQSNAGSVIITTAESSVRLDKQVKRADIIDLDYATKAGPTLLMLGHVNGRLFLAVMDGTTNSRVFYGFLESGWTNTYTHKPGAQATFALATQSAAAAELAKLGMPELTLAKLAKKGILFE